MFYHFFPVPQTFSNRSAMGGRGSVRLVLGNELAENHSNHRLPTDRWWRPWRGFSESGSSHTPVAGLPALSDKSIFA